MREVVLVSGARTAVGNFNGSLKGVKCADLGAVVIKEALKRAGLRPAIDDFIKNCRPDTFGDYEMTEINRRYCDYDEALHPVYVDECIMGNVLQSAQGQNPARQAAIYAGLPEETNAFTVNKVCASGMQAIVLAAQAIMTGDADIMVAGGMENMSNVPYALPDARWGARMNMPFGRTIDLMVHDGLYEIFNRYHMGVTAENIAKRYAISREAQDRLSLLSHRRARAAIENGGAREEIVPVTVARRNGDPLVFDVDERPMDTTLEKLAALKPAFDMAGTVTAGNASGINDGACAVILMAEEVAARLGIEPLARILGFASGGVDPAYMGLGPIPATRKALNLLNLTIDEIDRVELHEAFASQAIACLRELNVDPNRCNVNGSGISIGHPIGCTGARITFSLALQMKKDNLRRGLACLCIGGGQGMALVLERV